MCKYKTQLNDMQSQKNVLVLIQIFYVSYILNIYKL